MKSIPEIIPIFVPILNKFFLITAYLGTLIIVTIAPGVCHSQTPTESSGYTTKCFGINFGTCIPTGEYASTDASKEPIAAAPGSDISDISGYAKTGFHAEVYGIFSLGDYTGGMISLNGSWNSYNTKALANNFALLSAQNGYTGVAPAFTADGDFHIFQLLVGPYFAFPVSYKIKIELKGLFGLTSANYPIVSSSPFNPNNGAGVITVTYSYSGANNLGYVLGAGIKYKVWYNVGLHLDVSYSGSSISYPTSPQGSNSTNSNLDMSLGMILLTGGVSVDL